MRIEELATPCYVIDEAKLKENLRILKGVQDETGCRILWRRRRSPVMRCIP